MTCIPVSLNQPFRPSCRCISSAALHPLLLQKLSAVLLPIASRESLLPLHQIDNTPCRTGAAACKATTHQRLNRGCQHPPMTHSPTLCMARKALLASQWIKKQSSPSSTQQNCQEKHHRQPLSRKLVQVAQTMATAVRRIKKHSCIMAAP